MSNRTLHISFEDGQEVIVKVSIKESRFSRIIVESELIQRLASETDLPLPKVLYTDSTRTYFQYPFVVYSFLGGVNLVDAIEGIEEKDIVGVELANIAYQIHQIEFETPQFSLAKDEKTDSWKVLVQGVCEAGIAKLNEQGYEWVGDVRRYVEANMQRLEEPASYRLIHRDLQPQNIHWSTENNKVAGVFDFEAAMSGDFLFEFAYLEMRLFRAYPEIREAFYRAYSELTPLRADYEQVVEFYEVVRDLIFYPRNINYGELDRAGVVLKSIERVVLDKGI